MIVRDRLHKTVIVTKVSISNLAPVCLGGGGGPRFSLSQETRFAFPPP